jgi:hypothetical protein
MGIWAAAGFRRLSAVAHGLPSGLAVAPKVASAPRGQLQAPLAGNPAQSLPRARVHSEQVGNKLKTSLVFIVPVSDFSEFNSLKIGTVFFDVNTYHFIF